MHGHRGPRSTSWAIAIVMLVLAVLAGCSAVAGQGSADPAALARLSSSVSATTSTPRTTSSGPTETGGPVITSPTTSTSSTSAIEDSKVTGTGSSTSAQPGQPVLIGIDDFSVSHTVSTVWAQGLARAGYRVGVRTFDRITQQIKALEGGQVDLILGYNAELLYQLNPNSRAVTRSAIDEDLATSAPSGTKVLRSAEANDGSVVIVSKTNADKYHLTSLDDLSTVPEKSVTMALPDDKDTTKNLTDDIKDIYGTSVAKTVVADYGGPKTLQALKSGSALLGLTSDSSAGFISDPIVALSDPGHLFPPQNPVPMFSSVVDAKAQDVVDAIDRKLTTTELRKLRDQFNNSTESTDQIALDWLKKQGLA